MFGAAEMMPVAWFGRDPVEAPKYAPVTKALVLPDKSGGMSTDGVKELVRPGNACCWDMPRKGCLGPL